MLKKAAIPLAEIVESGFAIGGYGKAVFGTLAVAQTQPAATATLPRQGIALILAKLELGGTVHHVEYSPAADIAEFILRKYKMVAGIKIAVMLYDCRVAASARH